MVTGVSTGYTRPGMVNANFSVYHLAAETYLAGGDIYAVAPEAFPTFFYRYPPGTVLAFVPFTIVDAWSGYLGFSVLSVGAGGLLGWICLRTVSSAGPEVGSVDKLLVTAACLVTPYTVPNLVFGNVNLLLAAALAVGLFALERDEQTTAGLLIGAVVSVKLFPATVGAWLLRRRAWRGVAAAAAVGVVVLAVGLMTHGLDVTQFYLAEVLLDEARAGGEIGDPARAYVTLHRPIGLLVDGGAWRYAIAVALLAPAVGYCYTVIETPMDRLVAMGATVIAMLLVVPATFTYLPLVTYPLLPLLYLLDGRVRSLSLMGWAITQLSLTLRREAIVSAVLPDPIAEATIEWLRTLLELGTPPTFGLLLLLAAFALRARSHHTENP